MTQPITGIDHCIILVHDLDTARERIENLGFRATPRGVHSEHMGTHNHCVMLERGYFEVMAILKRTEHNAPWRKKLARREGLNGIALQTGDARAAYDAFHTAGIDAQKPVDFARPVDLASGPTEARFTVTGLPAEATPGAGMFVCEHHTPELVWQPEYLPQPNGAIGLHGLTIVAERPGDWQGEYARLFGGERVAQVDSLRIDTDRGVIDIMTPATLAARYPGTALDADAIAPYIAALTLTTTDPITTRAYLERQGVPISDSARGGVCVAPADACGVIFEFLPAAQPE